MRKCGFLGVTLAALLCCVATEESTVEWIVSAGGDVGSVEAKSPLADVVDLPIGDEGADNGGVVPNIRRRRRREVCGMDYNLSDEEKVAVVNTHNTLRSLEGASDMLKVVWSDRMARRAHQWASECTWTHGMTKDCDGNSIGQNLFMARDKQNDYPHINVTSIINKGWWAEKQFYNFTSVECRTNKSCGHYTQVVWAKTLEVGCSIVKCPIVTEGVPIPWEKAVILACDYTPDGNYLGQKPYVKGSACSKCASAVSKGYMCRNDLCVSCNPVTSPDTCICVEKTCVNGYFDQGLCECVCPEGKWGDFCSKNCECVDVYPYCEVISTMCFVESYLFWLKSYCQATCPNACDKPPAGVCGNDPEPDACESNPCEHYGTCSDGLTGYICSCKGGYTGTRCETEIDECASNPCLHGGSCSDLADAFSCSCDDGYTGSICQTDINECSSNPCCNGGSCTDIVNGFICTCVSGYTGTKCGIDTNECTPDLCQNGGSCTDLVDDYVCSCVAGYTGNNCEEEINECSPNPCKNGGSCTDLVNSFSCSCVAGYNGADCSNDINECSPNPCKNGGSCADLVNGFSCSCVAGYNEDDCSNDINGCTPNPCQNGGSCTDMVDGYVCSCAAGYTGNDCDEDINECSPNPCKNGGSCTDLVNGFSCSCVAGYTGEDCGSEINECSPNPCNNGGTCTDLVNGFSCSCVAGYNGDDCSNDINECTPNPCQNGGSCTDMDGEYVCSCAAGYTGINCEEDINECLPNPCRNGGSCTDLISGFSCTCVAGYIGADCSDGVVGINAITINQEVCSPNPCQHSGTCKALSTGYSCLCTTQYSGDVCQTAIKVITDVSFDKGWNGMEATNWFYFQSINVRIVSGKFGQSAYFNGKASIVLAIFTNNYRQFNKISITFWYKRKDTGSATEGLITNGNSNTSPSILISSNKNSLSVVLKTETNTVRKSGIPALLGKWHHVALSYNGKTLEVYVDNVKTVVGAITGRILEKNAPIVIGRTGSGLIGLIDELCFYKTGLSEAYVKKLFNK